MNPDDNKRRTYWSTKYALTTGIKELHGKREGVHTGNRREYIYLAWNPTGLQNPTGGWTQHVFDKNAFETRDEAVRAAKTEQKKKIASLKKSIERIKKLDFEPSGD